MSFQDRFWKKVEKTDTCWLWTAGTFYNGYGAVSVSGKAEYTHRVSYELHFGEIPDGMFVRHTCDNRGCVNPGHLFLGSPGNTHARGSNRRCRGPKMLGSSNPSAKLTEDDIEAIRRHYWGDGVQQKVLAEQFKVSRSTICDIVNGKGWRHTV